MFKGIANFASGLRQIQQMGSRMKEMNERLQCERVSGQAGGGMVTVEVNGLGEVLKVSIDPSLMNDREMLESLLPAACNQAQTKAKQAQMASMTDGLNVPGLDQALQQMTGQPPGQLPLDLAEEIAAAAADDAEDEDTEERGDEWSPSNSGS